MKQIKKKKETLSRKSVKSSAKKKLARKAVKPSAKKKATTITKKKAKGPSKKKVVSPAIKKIKKTRSKKRNKLNQELKVLSGKTSVPEVVKQDEVAHPAPVFSETHPNTIDEHKKFDRQFRRRDDVAMNQENQKVKSAMAKRQTMKRIFHTPRS